MLEIETVSFECVCAVHMDDPLAQTEIITPSDLDGRPMGALLEHHTTTQLLSAVFLRYGARLDLRYLTQYFLPLLNFVERRTACVVLDPISAESYRLFKGAASEIVFRPFAPTLPFDVALLHPTHRPASMIAESFRARVLLELQRISHLNKT